MTPDPMTGKFIPVGDPTEGALLVATSQAGMHKDDLEIAFPRQAEFSLDSDRKRMTTVHAVPKDENSLPVSMETIDTPYIGLTKGAVDEM